MKRIILIFLVISEAIFAAGAGPGPGAGFAAGQMEQKERKAGEADAAVGIAQKAINNQELKNKITRLLQFQQGFITTKAETTVKEIEQLLEKGAELSFRMPEFFNLMDYAIALGKPKLVQRIIDAGYIDPDKKFSFSTLLAANLQNVYANFNFNDRDTMLEILFDIINAYKQAGTNLNEAVTSFVKNVTNFHRGLSMDSGQQQAFAIIIETLLRAGAHVVTPLPEKFQKIINEIEQKIKAEQQCVYESLEARSIPHPIRRIIQEYAGLPLSENPANAGAGAAAVAGQPVPGAGAAASSVIPQEQRVYSLEDVD